MWFKSASIYTLTAPINGADVLCEKLMAGEMAQAIDDLVGSLGG